MLAKQFLEPFPLHSNPELSVNSQSEEIRAQAKSIKLIGSWGLLINQVEKAVNFRFLHDTTLFAFRSAIDTLFGVEGIEALNLMKYSNENEVSINLGISPIRFVFPLLIRRSIKIP